MNFILLLFVLLYVALLSTPTLFFLLLMRCISVYCVFSFIIINYFFLILVNDNIVAFVCYEYPVNRTL